MCNILCSEFPNFPFCPDIFSCIEIAFFSLHWNSIQVCEIIMHTNQYRGLLWLDWFLSHEIYIPLVIKNTLSQWKWFHWMAFPYEVKGISNGQINLSTEMPCTLSINLQHICYAEAWENADLLRMTWLHCCFWLDYYCYL